MAPYFLQLFAAFSVLLTPFAGADEPLALPLPQEIDYTTYLRGQLLAAHFSTDPLSPLPQVAAEQTNRSLEAFIINYEPCVLVKDVVAYRLVVRNVSPTPIEGVTAQFRYPKEILQFKEGTAFPPAALTNSGETITWNIGTVLPGHENWREANLTFVAIAAVGGLTTDLTVNGGPSVVLTSHTVPANCPGTQLEVGEALPSKQPVIVCDPGEIGCQDSAPTLGTLFNAVRQNPARQPTICSPLDPDGCTPNQPQLGVRFAEAVASLLPGECSVIEDAILAEPDFHDGLNRRADVAALFMRPLYDSGQDFSRLVLENKLLGIKNMLHAQNVLRAIHTKHWQKRIIPLENVLRGALTTDAIRSQINQWHLDWVEETREAQKDLQKRYQTLQAEREKKFVPVADQAIVNATTSLERACGAPPLPPREDGGLRPLLYEGPTSVQSYYSQNLQQRVTVYQAVQDLFVDPNNPLFPEENRATTWQTELRAALDAFDAGQRQPLERFVASIPQKDQTGFATGWRLTYLRHADEDVLKDDAVRLARWEVALDTPKKAAAECARDTTLAARVDVSWCESGLYPKDYILPETRDFPTVRDTTSPALVLDGEKATIDPQRVVGEACRGLPGDPYWAPDCSCNCKTLIANRSDGKIRFCRVGAEEEKKPDESPVAPGPTPSSCDPIVCPAGDTYPACDRLGRPIVYATHPCATRPIPSVPVEQPLPTRNPQPGQPTPLPTRANTAFSPSTQSFFFSPLPQPPTSPSEPSNSQPPAQNGSERPIIRHDIYAIAQAPRTQDECLQEKALDDHFLVNYPP